MRKPTITEIKQSEVLGPCFFSEENMKFFNQTMEEFEIEWFDKENGIIRIYAHGRIQFDNPVGKVFKKWDPTFKKRNLFDVEGLTERFVDISNPEKWVELKKHDLQTAENTNNES